MESDLVSARRGVGLGAAVRKRCDARGLACAAIYLLAFVFVYFASSFYTSTSTHDGELTTWPGSPDYCHRIFIGGVHHSGTTLIQHQLLHLAFPEDTRGRHPERWPDPNLICPTTKYVINKKPTNTLDEMKKMLGFRDRWPDIRLIYVKRDLPNQVWSILKRDGNVNWFPLFIIQWSAEAIRDQICKVNAFWDAAPHGDLDWTLQLSNYTHNAERIHEEVMSMPGHDRRRLNVVQRLDAFKEIWNLYELILDNEREHLRPSFLIDMDQDPERDVTKAQLFQQTIDHFRKLMKLKATRLVALFWVLVVRDPGAYVELTRVVLKSVDHNHRRQSQSKRGVSLHYDNTTYEREAPRALVEKLHGMKC